MALTFAAPQKLDSTPVDWNDACTSENNCQEVDIQHASFGQARTLSPFTVNYQSEPYEFIVQSNAFHHSNEGFVRYYAQLIDVTSPTDPKYIPYHEESRPLTLSSASSVSPADCYPRDKGLQCFYRGIKEGAKALITPVTYTNLLKEVGDMFNAQPSFVTAAKVYDVDGDHIPDVVLQLFGGLDYLFFKGLDDN